MKAEGLLPRNTVPKSARQTALHEIACNNAISAWELCVCRATADDSFKFDQIAVLYAPVSKKQIF
jgi:hypothetical protein